MRTKFKPWAQPFIEENPDLIILRDEVKNSAKLQDFLNRDNLYLEIGPGKGMFIATLAERYPSYNFICVEINLTVSAICAKLVKEKGLSNVFIVSDDIFNLFELVKDKTFSGIFLNHSDPWPKKRHEKRRLTHKNFLDQYKRILKSDGRVYVKTDNLDLFDWSIESFNENGWTLEHVNYDYQDDVEFDALTNYELNFKEKNVPIKRLEAYYKEKK